MGAEIRIVRWICHCEIDQGLQCRAPRKHRQVGSAEVLNWADRFYPCTCVLLALPDTAVTAGKGRCKET
jgi:hypothetical protein